MNFLKYIFYAFRAKEGIQHPDEFMKDASFGFLETTFILSFFILSFVVVGLAFLAFRNQSDIALFFAILFFFVLSLDVYIYVKIKRLFKKMSKKIISFSQEQIHKIQKKNPIDVSFEEE